MEAKHPAASTTKTKSRRPKDNDFWQQRLSVQNFDITRKRASAVFLVAGLIFLPTGIGLYFLNEKALEVGVDYTHCKQFFWENGTTGDVECWRVITNLTRNCSCVVNLTLTVDIPGQVFLYYELSNYYQNYRQYQSSRDDEQLQGQLSKTVSSDCAPLRYDDEGKPIAPCGLIANSLFNDSIRLRRWQEGRVSEVPLLYSGIAWPVEKMRRFRNPPASDLKKAFEGYAKPPNWRQHVYELDPDNPDNNGFLNEDLIVWMRIAALSTFRKIYRLVDHSTEPQLHRGLPAGSYDALINYSYPVIEFNGIKRLLVMNTTLLGAHNKALSYLFIAVGCLCLVLALIFKIIAKPKVVLVLVNNEMSSESRRSRQPTRL